MLHQYNLKVTRRYRAHSPERMTWTCVTSLLHASGAHVFLPMIARDHDDLAMEPLRLHNCYVFKFRTTKAFLRNDDDLFINWEEVSSIVDAGEGVPVSTLTYPATVFPCSLNVPASAVRAAIVLGPGVRADIIPSYGAPLGYAGGGGGGTLANVPAGVHTNAGVIAGGLAVAASPEVVVKLPDPMRPPPNPARPWWTW
jgi:hypothetical protein